MQYLHIFASKETFIAEQVMEHVFLGKVGQNKERAQAASAIVPTATLRSQDPGRYASPWCVGHDVLRISGSLAGSTEPRDARFNHVSL